MADEWISAATGQLERLAGERHYSKMRGTIIAIVGARLAGESEETVWEPRRPETCSRSIYHGKWKKAPLFADVLEQVHALAVKFQDGKSLRAKQQAAERLALAAPVAVATAIREMQSEDPAVRLRAAFGILDRAGLETAASQTVAVKGPIKHEHAIDNDAASTIFDILAAIGAVQSGTGDATDDEVYPAEADT
mgnify:FL=1